MNIKTKENKKEGTNSLPKLPYIDSAYLSLNDYERIKRNVYLPSKEEILNEEIIRKEQESDKTAKARALRDKIINYDIKNPKIKLSDLDQENIQTKKRLIKLAQKMMDDNEDCVKEMEILCKYAKIATIRDKQLEEKKKLDKIYKRKEKKLDTMMELERLKELKYQQEKEESRKKQNREGSLIIIDQIADKQREKLKQKELIEKEQKIIVQQIKDLQEKELRELQNKQIQSEKIAKEIEEANKISALSKQKKILEEKEEEIWKKQKKKKKK